MKCILKTGWFAVTILVFTACKGQSGNQQPAEAEKTAANQPVGGYCEGCELIYAGMPATMAALDTSVGWAEPGQKLLVRGTVYKRDGKTPAPDVILYYYHTDNNGYYSPGPGMPEKAKRHGHIRGWVKTGADGRYAIYTIRPAPYPNRQAQAHIHPVIKEPDIENEYYIDEWVFDDDPLLTTEIRRKMENRGGNGIMKVRTSGDLQIAERDIILGLNVPDYPQH
ncbi:MAG: intradiol ring-cleavage dioxygenase [Lewinellaceae bacterium]|nr:intradiol ring-cleavage dioxygenase [Lewinellaceae bacterium]